MLEGFFYALLSHYKLYFTPFLPAYCQNPSNNQLYSYYSSFGCFQNGFCAPHMLRTPRRPKEGPSGRRS